MLPGKILIAEDEESFRDALKLFLFSKNFDATLVEDGASAMEELVRSQYDLLITDLIMPRVSGEELIEFVRKMPSGKQPAVIVMTGHGTIESAIKGIKTGIAAFLRKPLDFHELEVAMCTAIENLRLEKDLERYYRELDRKVEERTRNLSHINAFSALINCSFDLEEILDKAVEYLVDSLETDAAWIYLIEDGIQLKASRGFSVEFIKGVPAISAVGGSSDVTFKEGGAFICDDISISDFPMGKMAAMEGFRTAIHTEISSGEKLLGGMCAASRSGKKFQDSHLQILTSFGNQIGVAIDKIKLYEKEKALARDLERKINQLVIMNWMGSRARVSSRMDEAAVFLVSSIVEALDFDRVCLWLMDAEPNSLYLAACHGVDHKMGTTRIKLDGPPFSNLPLEEGEAFKAPLSICDLHSQANMREKSDGGEIALAPLVTFNPENLELRCWEHFKCSVRTCPARKNTAISCWMIKDSCLKWTKRSSHLLDKMKICGECPVYKTNTKGRNIGMLCADNKISGRPISNDDLKTLNVFANSAAVIFENIMRMDRLKKDERFIDSIIFNMSSGLMVTDRQGVVKMINNAGAEIFRCVREDLLDKPFQEVFPEAEEMLYTKSCQPNKEVEIKIKDGLVPVGYSNSMLVEVEGSEPEGVIIVFRDLSEIKKLHEKLREKERFAAIGKVAAGVAHEIRNPLFGITSVAQIVAREVGSGTPLTPLIDAMLAETARLNTLVEEMLLYGRNTKISPQPVDIKELIESVVSFHIAGINEKGIKLLMEFDPSLPWLMLDPNQIRQVFLNLLVNAVDASNNSGEIRIDARKTITGAVVSISDSGIGIHEDDLSKVFDLFYTTKDKGTGLGLAICRKIVEDHGGTVSIISSPGQGTTVELGLPCAAVQEKTA